MLHIRCGTDIVADLRTGGVPGEILVWQDPLCLGPTPALPPAAWYETRAAFISQACDLEVATVRAQLEAADAGLARSLDQDEVVLWFEHDMFDQSILARLLAWYEAAPLLPRRLSIVTANSHPDVPRFIGLGNLNATQLMGLFARRSTLGAEALALGREVWSGWIAADPRGLAALSRREMPELPWMPAAIRRHLEELPWTTDGLGLTERLILDAIGDGATGRTVFLRVMSAEAAPWMGDTMCYHAIRELAAGEVPLISVAGRRTGTLDEIADLVIRRTAAGEAVLAGGDRLAPRTVDRWVGGVKLHGAAPRWQWDPEPGTPREVS